MGAVLRKEGPGSPGPSHVTSPPQRLPSFHPPDPRGSAANPRKSVAESPERSMHPMAHRRRPEGLPERLPMAMVLPVERRCRHRLVADLGHVRGHVEQATIDHHVARVGGMADVLQRIAVQYYQVRALADLQRTQLR